MEFQTFKSLLLSVINVAQCTEHSVTIYVGETPFVTSITKCNFRVKQPLVLEFIIFRRVSSIFANFSTISFTANVILSKYSSRPTTITSNLSEVEMNICIIVYLFMSFVGHIEVKESPSKILKLIHCIFICIFSATE